MRLNSVLKELLIVIMISLLTNLSIAQTNPIDQETLALHIKSGAAAPWEGVLIKEKLFRFYRDKTDQAAYLQNKLLEPSPEPGPELTIEHFIIVGLLALAVGFGAGVVATHH